MFAMAFSTVALIACGDDDKENEEVVDPLETEKEYYIVGTVTATGGALTGAQVDTGNNLTATTDAQGVYMLTVKETGEYNLKFTATDMESMESKVTIAASAANRTQTTLNVKMAKAISFENVEEVTVEADKETNVEAAQNETSAEEAATTTTVSVPAQAAEEGTTIAAVTYEEPKASTSEEVAETPKEEAVPVTAVERCCCHKSCRTLWRRNLQRRQLRHYNSRRRKNTRQVSDQYPAKQNCKQNTARRI